MIDKESLKEILNKGKETFNSGYTYDENGNSYLFRIFEYNHKTYKFEYLNGEMFESYEAKKTSWMEYKCDWVKV